MKNTALLCVLALLPGCFARSIELYAFPDGIEVTNKKKIQMKHPTFTSIGDYVDKFGLTMVEVKNSRYGFVNQKGDIVVPPVYKSISWSCNSPFISIGLHDDKTGEYIHHIYSIKIPNIHFVEKQGMIAVEDNSFKRLSGFDYDWLDYETGCAKRHGEYGTIDAKGIFRVKKELQGFHAQGKDLGFNPVIVKDGKVGMIDSKLNFTLPAKYDSIQRVAYNSPQVIVKIQGRYGVVTPGVNAGSAIVLYDKITPVYHLVNRHPDEAESDDTHFYVEGGNGEIKTENYQIHATYEWNNWTDELFCFKAEKAGKVFYLDVNGTKILNTKEAEDEINLNKVFEPYETQHRAEYQGDLYSEIRSLIMARKKAKNSHGMVDVKFIINKDGTISDETIETGADKELEQEAIRIVKQLKKWNPATIGNKKVRSYETVRLDFYSISK